MSVQNEKQIIYRYIVTANQIVEKYRKKNNLSLEEMGKRLGVSKQMISQIENNKKKVSKLLVEKINKNFSVLESDKKKFDDYFEYMKYSERAKEYIQWLTKRAMRADELEEIIEDIDELENVLNKITTKRILKGKI